jgi:putative polyketide hydroxylase
VGTGPDAELAPEDGAEWSACHGTEPGGAVLVRPDGFVAWRAPAPARDAAAELRRVLTEVLAVG